MSTTSSQNRNHPKYPTATRRNVPIPKHITLELSENQHTGQIFKAYGWKMPSYYKCEEAAEILDLPYDFVMDAIFEKLEKSPFPGSWMERNPGSSFEDFECDPNIDLDGEFVEDSYQPSSNDHWMSEAKKVYEDKNDDHETGETVTREEEMSDITKSDTEDEMSALSTESSCVVIHEHSDGGSWPTDDVMEDSDSEADTSSKDSEEVPEDTPKAPEEDPKDLPNVDTGVTNLPSNLGNLDIIDLTSD